MDAHEDYVRSLTREEAQLLALRIYLYEGSWDDMVADLVARREGRPFVFKLQTRIEEDLQRIENLRRYEEENQVDLGRYARRTAEGPSSAGEAPESPAPLPPERRVRGRSASRTRLGRGR
jgi:hypothetical protein